MEHMVHVEHAGKVMHVGYDQFMRFILCIPCIELYPKRNTNIYELVTYDGTLGIYLYVFTSTSFFKIWLTIQR